AGYVAALPFAVVQSRVGYDCAQTPVYAALLFSFAFRANLPAVAGLLVVTYLVHPMNVFAAPCVIAVHAARSVMRDRERGGRPSWRRVLAHVAVLLAVVAALGVDTLRKPKTQLVMGAHSLGPAGRHDLGAYLVALVEALTASGTLSTGRPSPALS